MESQILKGLNQAQRDAVVNYDSPSLIIAGAGSGKTRDISSSLLQENKNTAMENKSKYFFMLMILINKKSLEESSLSISSGDIKRGKHFYLSLKSICPRFMLVYSYIYIVYGNISRSIQAVRA